MKHLTVDSRIFTPEGQNALRCKMALELVKSLNNCFSESERRSLVGHLRGGRLDILSSPVIVDKLDEARLKGNMPVKDFKGLYQLTSLVKKAPVQGDDDKCRSAALAKLLKGEDSCRHVNNTIGSRVSENYAFFDRVKRIIGDILGNVPDNVLTSTPQIFFGPGSTVNLQSRSFEETGLFYKLTDRMIIPEKAKWDLAILIASHPNWVDMLAAHYRTQKNSDESQMSYVLRVLNRHIEVVPNEHPSKISFVPKNSDEHRTIGVEMNGLVPLQKVVGDLIRDRLCVSTKGRINLNTQDRNKHLARMAKTFGLATIDLANASSSISLELVREILPYDWFCLINCYRSEFGHEPKSDMTVKYEMVSSMGNGFTFELESLIFYAVVKATCEEMGLNDFEINRSVAVYGDDIIVPRAVAPQLYERLTLFGFAVNEDKSFTKGFFFESCGADYYDGHDVRPFFLRRDILTIKDMYFLLNSLLFKVITQDAVHLLGLYRCLYRSLSKVDIDYGPLHFNSGHYSRLSTDDLQSVLRVPLEFAQANGGVKFDTNLQAWSYDKWVYLGVPSPLSLNVAQYAVKHARYMTFLRGVRKGEVLLRGRVKTIKKRDTVSDWNGIISTQEARTVKYLFDSLAF